MPGMQDPVDDSNTCTTTKTYSSSSSTSVSFPSASSWSWTGTESGWDFDFTFSESSSRLHSFTRTGDFYGWGTTGSHSGNYTQHDADPGSKTYSWICLGNGTASYSHWQSSKSSYTSSYSSTLSGTKTATCEEDGNMVSGPILVTPEDSPQHRMFDAEGEVLMARSRRRVELRLQMLGPDRKKAQQEWHELGL